MPTVRLRSAAEYPSPAQRMFELSRAWFNHDFADTLQLEPDMGDIAPADSSPAPGGPWRIPA
jgi:hypothetical protein